MTDILNAPVRLAMRVEGDWWVAYLAKPNSMDGANELGRILLNIVGDPENKRAFMELMSKVVADLIEDAIGSRPDMLEQPAPEHEKSGRA